MKKLVGDIAESIDEIDQLLLDITVIENRFAESDMGFGRYGYLGMREAHSA